MIPAMERAGYSKPYAAAVTAAAGGLGIVIPPSIPMVIFGISAMGLQVPPEALERFGTFGTVSISKLFIAGFLPGLVMAGSLLAVNYYRSRLAGYYGRAERISIIRIATALYHGVWSILAPLVILGGIYAGIFTPTEAAVAAIFYTIFVGVFVYGELTLSRILAALETTTWLTGRILLVLFTATLFGRILVENQIPSHLADMVLSFTTSKAAIWGVSIALLLVVGMFMETLAAIMILVPVMLPVAYSVGIDPTHFGIVMICTLSVGFITPPLGENLFIASGISRLDYEVIALKAVPYMIALTVAIIIIAAFPPIALWLPHVMGY